MGSAHSLPTAATAAASNDYRRPLPRRLHHRTVTAAATKSIIADLGGLGSSVKKLLASLSCYANATTTDAMDGVIMSASSVHAMINVTTTTNFQEMVTMDPDVMIPSFKTLIATDSEVNIANWSSLDDEAPSDDTFAYSINTMSCTSMNEYMDMGDRENASDMAASTCTSTKFNDLEERINEQISDEAKRAHGVPDEAFDFPGILSNEN